MKKKLYLIAGIVILIFAGMQFVSRSVENPPATNPIKAPDEVVSILRRACYDCHSNESRLSWYDKIAPASWLVSADVKEARSRFNFSTWDTLNSTDQQGRVWEIVNMILTKKMPLPSYASFHAGATLSDGEIAVLKKYANDLSPASYHDSAIIAESDREYERFRKGGRADTKGLEVANGIQYIPDFQNWQVISTTNRFDNHSIRVVYGNDIVVKAIKENHINPLPEGSTIVKAVWNSIEEKNGEINPGSLNSIQIMTKDSKRFSDSKGWGFAKFNGIGLKPYGSTAAFNTTCFNCHKAASNNDYVFNLPLDRGNMFDAGGLKVVTSFANRTNQTMSVLYGGSGNVYKMVTFRQADNKYWYGSYISGPVLHIATADSSVLRSHRPSVFP